MSNIGLTHIPSGLNTDLNGIVSNNIVAQRTLCDDLVVMKTVQSGEVFQIIAASSDVFDPIANAKAIAYPLAAAESYSTTVPCLKAVIKATTGNSYNFDLSKLYPVIAARIANDVLVRALLKLEIFFDAPLNQDIIIGFTNGEVQDDASDAVTITSSQDAESLGTATFKVSGQGRIVIGAITAVYSGDTGGVTQVSIEQF